MKKILVLTLLGISNSVWSMQEEKKRIASSAPGNLTNVPVYVPELTVELPPKDGKQIIPAHKEDVDMAKADPITLETLEDARQGQENKNDSYLIVRVYEKPAVNDIHEAVFGDTLEVRNQKSEFRKAYYATIPRIVTYLDAHVFNRLFFDYAQQNLQGVGSQPYEALNTGYPIELPWKADIPGSKTVGKIKRKKYRNPVTRALADTNNDILYFIYQPATDDKAAHFEYFCSYRDAGKLVDGKRVYFFNDLKNSPWQGKSQDYFLNYFYENQNFDEPKYKTLKYETKLLQSAPRELLLGKKAFEEYRYDVAETDLKKVLELKEAMPDQKDFALRLIGDMYEVGGPGIVPSESEAWKWYEKLSEKYSEKERLIKKVRGVSVMLRYVDKPKKMSIEHQRKFVKRALDLAVEIEKQPNKYKDLYGILSIIANVMPELDEKASDYMKVKQEAYNHRIKAYKDLAAFYNRGAPYMQKNEKKAARYREYAERLEDILLFEGQAGIQQAPSEPRGEFKRVAAAQDDEEASRALARELEEKDRAAADRARQVPPIVPPEPVAIPVIDDEFEWAREASLAEEAERKRKEAAAQAELEAGLEASRKEHERKMQEQKTRQQEAAQAAAASAPKAPARRVSVAIKHQLALLHAELLALRA